MDVKTLKNEFRQIASKNPEKYYAVSVLLAEGFKRYQCSNCQRNFWSIIKKDVCGDPACSGGYRFIESPPARHKLGYIEVWQKFAEFFKKRGYEPIQRYPVAARWRDDTDFVQASIYDFQPYVVSGEVDPPANPLVVPQFCLRFNDIDNVGITGAHYTGFVMIGQHAFMPQEKWDQAKYFLDIHEWLVKGLGLDKEELTYHEDAWAGGGNFGPCMEYFSRGLELGNQVYMLYEQTPSGNKELKLRVLDMGMGHERNAWFTQGHSTSYEVVFPTVMQRLYKETGFKPNHDLVKRFLPYAAYLNMDEIDDPVKAWSLVAKKVGVSPEVLRAEIQPLSALYSIAEHSRTLLFALNDGVLPSNTAGGYNLRVILRRALGFSEKYGWKLSLPEICRLHAAYLKPIFPELTMNLKEIENLLDIEAHKYKDTRGKAGKIIGQALDLGINTDSLVTLYDSHGITPEMVLQESKARGFHIEIPEDFYSKVSERHTEQTWKTELEEKYHIQEDLPGTEALYYGSHKVIESLGEVLASGEGWAVLDKTAFYPTSGGQEHDIGTLDGHKVQDVIKQGRWIVHLFESKIQLPVGKKVECKIDPVRRFQLAKHHTATHLLNGLARKMLGSHVWQAGAAKSFEKARLDITHFEALTKGQLETLEKEANDYISRNIPVHKFFLSRKDAEKKYGMSLYQGGVVPGNNLRIVDIEGLDVEACGGTHLDNTSELGKIRILRSTKIQDGIVRLEYVAGQAAEAMEKSEGDLEAQVAQELGCSPGQIPARTAELFEKWKKAVKKGQEVDTALHSTDEYEGDVLAKSAEILKTQKEHILKTLKRFKSELENYKKA